MYGGCASLGEFQLSYCLSMGSLAGHLTSLSLNVLIYKVGFKVAASEVSVKLNQVCVASGEAFHAECLWLVSDSPPHSLFRWFLKIDFVE